MLNVNTTAAGMPAEWLATVLDAVRAVRFGSVELTIHDAQVVQVERRERIRLTDPTVRLKEAGASGRTAADRTGGSHDVMDPTNGRG